MTHNPLPQPQSDAPRACVLLVDDSDIVRDVSRALLEDAGVMVEEAADGAAALDWLRAHSARCALVLMDVQMPVLDGVAATRALRAELGERAPPVVALTAHTAERERQRCRDAGMCDFLTKPVDPARLNAVLGRWLTPPTRAAGDHGALPGACEPAAALPAVPGFDLQTGLACVGGNAVLLRALLTRFGARYDGVVTQLRLLLQNSDATQAHRIAHTLKGAAATLGGTAIAEAAARLEVALQPLRAPAAARAVDLSDLENALLRALPVLQALHQAPVAPSAAAPAASVALPPEAAADYAELRQLLAGNCYAARKAFAVLRDKLDARDAQWQAAGAAVDALEFQRALAQLDAHYPAHARELP
jgi:two-component system, sensor histidine kinase and response regulator